MAETPKTSIETSLAKTDAVTVEEASRASSVVDKAVAADPALMNELNQEPWWQSGILWFGTGGIIWAVGIVFTQIGTHGTSSERYDMTLLVAAVGALASPVGVLYRRFRPGLKPLFWRWTHRSEAK